MAYAISFTIIVALAAILPVDAASRSKLRCQNPNETYTPCENPCPTTCANKDEEPKKCPAVCKKEGACICKSGLIRGWDQSCIKPEECPTCEGPNEFFSCGSACDTTCATLGEECPITNIKCNEMCYCKEGFARDDRGVCIPIKNCPLRQCKEDPNAIAVPCGDPCPRTCENKDDNDPRACIEICIINGCKCKDGFVKGSDGKCIPVESCPSRQCSDDPNAITLPCGDPCPRTCENKDDQSPRGCKKICILNGCKCKDGFVKGNDGKCIPVERCPAPIICGKNEIYDKCPASCPPEETCQSYVSDIQFRCAPTTKCVPACRCKEGYIRNVKNGKCIRPDVCCGDRNSKMLTCPNPCPGGTCDNPNFAPCRMACRSRGCQCKEGFVKKSKTDPTCVASEDCESSSQVQPASHLASQDASAKTDTSGTPKEYECQQSNVTRSASRKKNANHEGPRACPLICLERDCVCKQGYVRGWNGKCIKPEECPTCKEPNEFYSCGSACDTTCATLGEQCNIINKKCTEMCYCKEGFARDSKGVCIADD
ncbi:zonadhesin-like [Arctopsyche grandis]|uniref:zonadhesin-like n=1 Tax=Arctopsyche grandis TaxID=121162 RepID=UPI00406D7742